MTTQVTIRPRAVSAGLALGMSAVAAMALSGRADAARITVQDPPETQSDYSNIDSGTFINAPGLIRGRVVIPGLHAGFGAHATLTLRAGTTRRAADAVVWTLSHQPGERTRLYRQGPGQATRHHRVCRGLQTVKVVGERGQPSYLQMSVPHRCIPGSRWVSFSFRIVVFDDDTHSDAVPGAQDGNDVPSGPPTGPYTRWVRRG